MINCKKFFLTMFLKVHVSFVIKEYFFEWPYLCTPEELIKDPITGLRKVPSLSSEHCLLNRYNKWQENTLTILNALNISNIFNILNEIKQQPYGRHLWNMFNALII